MQAKRFFNNSGPVNELDHFCVVPIKRLDTRKVWQLILQKKYFLICGPKQCGKTSYLLALAKAINGNQHAKCLYFNVESLRGVQENLLECMRSVLFEISSRARDTFGDDYLEDLVAGILEKRGPYQALNELLTQWSKRSPKPIVLLIDEIDTLGGAVLTSFLSQIRAGYDKRPVHFPQSIIFCATHDVIDKQFNIKDTSLRINLVRRDELDEMVASYTENHQVEVRKDAVDRIWHYSSGQPWVISTIAGELFHEIVPSKGLDHVNAEQIEEAIANILAKKGTHIEYMAAQLRDPRTKKCLIPLLAGGTVAEDLEESDLAFVQEIGLLRLDRRMEISNGLYKELVPRALFGAVSHMINLDADAFLGKDQSLDTALLLRTFQAFFRNHIERLVSLIDYGVAGYILAFQALLQKLDGGTAVIEREYGIDQGNVVLRLKRVYPLRQDAVFILRLTGLSSMDQFRQLLPELTKEAADLGASLPDQGADVHLVAINIHPEFDWEGKAPSVRKEIAGRLVHVWGM